MKLTIFEDHDDPFHRPLVVAYGATLAIAWFYAISRWRNLLAAVSHQLRGSKFRILEGSLPSELPHITIQIVTYNEEHVVLETIQRACAVDWPKNKLTVQVLDDSTKGSSQDLIAKAVATKKSEGVNVVHLKRPDRIGFKAGNLRHHFDSIEGDFVVQLDADHWLDKNFLKAAMRGFYNRQGSLRLDIGLVQAPWCYYNTHQNLLTEVDAFALDIHHVIEQTARCSLYGVFGFNGTGGIWRKEAIQAAGGWAWVSLAHVDLRYPFLLI